MFFLESKEYRDIRNQRRLKIGGDYGADVRSVRMYTRDSTSLNTKLVNGHALDDEEQSTHDALKRQSKPAGEHSSLYSGTGHDFGEMARNSKDGVIHSPAHISASRSQTYATKWGVERALASDSTIHLLHIKIKPSDKVCNFGGREGRGEGYWYEHETVIPAGTKLKYSHTTSHDLPLDFHDGKVTERHPVKVHHFAIHSQE